MGQFTPPDWGIYPIAVRGGVVPFASTRTGFFVPPAINTCVVVQRTCISWPWAGSGAQKPDATDDHHMLMAMCAPRALYDTGNTDYTWLGNPACYVCGQACAKIYHQFGLDDRYGFNVDGGHGHCSFPADQESDVQYFLNKFMLGQTNLSQIIRTAPSSYTNIDYSQWTTWWGTTNPVPGP